jgi:hypothetical protein
MIDSLLRSRNAYTLVVSRMGGSNRDRLPHLTI